MLKRGLGKQKLRMKELWQTGQVNSIMSGDLAGSVLVADSHDSAGYISKMQKNAKTIELKLLSKFPAQNWVFKICLEAYR